MKPPRPAYHFDYETGSPVDLFKVGAYRYGVDPETRILMFAIKKEDGPVYLWDYLAPKSPESRQALELLTEAAINPRALIYAHNAGFEVALTKYKLKSDIGLHSPGPLLSQWRCTMAMGQRAGLPQSLKDLAMVLGLEDGKDSSGRALITVFSKFYAETTLVCPDHVKDYSKSDRGKALPNRKCSSPLHGWYTKDEQGDEILWDWTVKVGGVPMTVKVAWEKFKAYCRQDVKVEAAIHRKLKGFELTGKVLESFQFNLRMNDRGIPVNVAALEHANSLIQEYMELMITRFANLTGGLRPTQNAKVSKWLGERGYEGGNLQADTIEEALKYESDIFPPDTLKVLQILQLVSFAALKKVPAMLASACPDGRVRGTMLWHGARTGRATGKIIQPQNMKKAEMKTALAYDMIRTGEPLCDFMELWESPMDVIASCARHFIELPGVMFNDADYKGVEARIAPWVVDDQEKLGSILAGEDQYKVQAMDIFGIAYEDVTSKQRTIAKPVELGCIAEGQLVLTDRGEVPIEKVELADLVWDGVEWVHHEGLIFQGYRETITYQGVTATPDHEVFIEGQERPVQIGEAKRKALKLLDAGAKGAPLRFICAGGETAFVEKGAPVCRSSVWVPKNPVGSVRFLTGWPFYTVPSLQREIEQEGTPSMVGGTIPCGERTLHKPGQPVVGELRRSGDRVQVRQPAGSGPMDDGKLRSASGVGDRPEGQRRTLRAGEHEVVDSAGAVSKHPEVAPAQGIRVPAGGVALQQGRNGAAAQGRRDAGGDLRASEVSGGAEDQELSSHPKKVRVYDLLNAGPRHRFTVSGKIVSNCQFGVGGKGLRNSLRDIHHVKLPLKQCKEIVAKYREANTKVTDAWKAIWGAVCDVVANGGVHTILKGKIRIARVRKAGMLFLAIELPGGRRLFYPDPRIAKEWKKYDKEDMAEDPVKAAKKGYWTTVLRFYGKPQKSAIWKHVATWNSRIFENIVQAIGADLLDEGCINAEKAGHDIFMIVHDQALSPNTEGKSELLRFCEDLCKVDPWADTFPLEADGDLAPYYQKID